MTRAVSAAPTESEEAAISQALVILAAASFGACLGFMFAALLHGDRDAEKDR
jgi:uncharacterized membrane protein